MSSRTTSYGEFSMPVTTPAPRQRTAAPPKAPKGTMPLENGRGKPDVTPENAPPLIRHFNSLLQWIIFFSKKILKIDPLIKAVCYLGLSVICSSLWILAEPYQEYSFFQKSSFFNQYFVKLSWGWTFWLLLAFFALCGYVEGGGLVREVARNVTRLLVGTVVWYTVTAVFIGGIERSTGKCSRDDIFTRKECLAGGNTWGHFDISGHAFLLVYCSLLILEEARGFFRWETEDIQDGPDVLAADRRFELVVKPRLLVAIHIITVAIAGLAVLWDWMLLITLVYYHSFVQRFLGVALGVLAWYGTYRLWYPRFYPGLPGDVEEEFVQ
ncbi:putative FIT family protein [Hypsibius exemplaris]|uniref:FIT family protein n=1 Tax=Hypsibius exemplaris TaxID=2072580 RepID=A0A9X6NC83_HYPEX|nr:putative FIT family protein [Hypsibius exemplaris]